MVPPNIGHPWDCFEEGMWYHPESFTEDYAWKIVYKISDNLPPHVLVRNKIIQCATNKKRECAMCNNQIVKRNSEMVIELL